MAQEAEHTATERLVFFSDAVLAIALTLLAIELPLPQGASNRDMLISAGSSRAEYVAFLVSFLVIAGHWRSHHRLFYFVDHTSPRLISLNLSWLLMVVVVTPFTTRLLINDGDTNLVRFATYAAVQAVQSALFIAMVAVIRRDGLLREAGQVGELRMPVWRGAVLGFAFAVSIPAYLLIGNAAFGVWVLLPVLASVVRRILNQVGHRDHVDDAAPAQPFPDDPDDEREVDQESASRS